MNRERLELLKSIQALEFSALEFHLYLNTHPGDQRALAELNNIVRELEPLRQMYIRNYGPLMPMDAVGQPCWRWIEEPWPWEIEY